MNWRMGLVVVMLVAPLGCRSQGNSRAFEAPEVYRDKSVKRDEAASRKHYNRAMKAMNEESLDDAERELKAAVKADLFNGLAHNNLGVIYYQKKQYYLAAWEFQYAAKLMPNKPEPLNNLGMVFEAVGKLDDAEEWYDRAITLEPGDVEAEGNLARVCVRQGRRDERTRELLTNVMMKDERPEWMAWAAECLRTFPSRHGRLQESAETIAP